MININSKIYQFKPTLLGIIITLICIPLFIKMGLWQYNKAQLKLNIQSAYQLAEDGQAKKFPLNVRNIQEKNNEMWKYKLVEVTGEYLPKYQLLLDNQVEANRAGYHVITPLKIIDSNEYVLVNRGWIPANNIHTDVPKVETPSGIQKVVGQVWIPSQQYFSLEEKQVNKTKKIDNVWQNMDLQRYQSEVPIKTSALMIKLSANSSAGGFIRNWDIPTERIFTNIGYAYQWFGFAIATFIIFIAMSFRITNK